MKNNELIDFLIEELQKLKKDGENINIEIDSGLEELTQTFEKAWYKKYINIFIKYDEPIIEKKRWF